MKLHHGLELLTYGKIPYIHLAELDIHTAIALTGAPIQDVVLFRDALFHIRDKHSDVTLSELDILPEALRDGLLIAENDDQKKACVCYESNEFGRRYNAALKVLPEKKLISCLTFHRARQRNTKSKMKRGRPIRLHS